MHSLFLPLFIVAIFGVLFVYETANEGKPILKGATGLLSWLISGNWPAKVGAGLVIIGVGALLRYAFANIDIAPELKLGSGAVASAVLGFGAMRLKSLPKRRPIHLAMAGAAFGIAYLTAYSAYGFFGYLNDVNALALLALVSIAAGTFAITSNAMSAAILAMVGAYIAPKFAIGTPGALQVYGYYLAVSILTLTMVTLRGWRPLIHLSFLFTLAGALFFGWSSRFYEPAHYTIMQPLLLALTLVHLVMPLVERKQVRSTRLLRFDALYFLLLPLVAAGLTLKISPNLRVDGSIGLGLLALIWGGTALILHEVNRGEVGRHAVVSVVLGIGAIFCFQKDLPWLQLGLVLSVLGMAIGARRRWPRNYLELACGATTLFGILNVIHLILLQPPAPVFLNELFAHRLFTSFLMMLGGWLGFKQSIKFAKLLGLVGVSWAILSILAELLRLDIDFLPQLVYGAILAGMAVSIVLPGRTGFPAIVGGLLLFSLVACGWWAVQGISNGGSIVYLGLTFTVLLGMAWAGRDSARQDGSDFSPSMAIGLLPFVLLPWAISISELGGFATDFFEASIAMFGIGVAGLSARLWLSSSSRWNERIQPLHVYLTAFSLLWVTLFHIERGVWPVVFEVLALAYLVAYVTRRSRERASVGAGIGVMMSLSVALFLQAMLLRGFGPDVVVMDVADVNKIQLPAAVSLMWAVFGAGLAWWGTQNKARSTWSIGALLLVVAALKLVFFDFGALGQLGNILAFIAAGLVFLGVAWFAPMPHKPAIEPVGLSDKADAEQQASQPAALEPLRTNTEPESTRLPRRPESRADTNPPPLVSPVAEIDHSATIPKTRRQGHVSTTYRYRDEPKGINLLWFLLVGLAIAVALFISSWHKYSRHKQLRLESQQVAKAQWQAKLAADLNGSPPTENLPARLPEAGRAATKSAQPEISWEALPTKNRAVSVASARAIKLVDACTNFVERLPSDYVVYAAGGYRGRQQGTVSSTRGHSTGSFDVVANLPGRPVVLALGAYEPSIWNIRWSPSTKVVGVLVSGYHAQIVPGLPQEVPVLNISYESKSPCGYFYLTRENAVEADASLQKILGRSAQRYMLAMDGRIDLGAAISVSSPSVQSNSKIERHIDQNGRVEYRQVVGRGE